MAGEVECGGDAADNHTDEHKQELTDKGLRCWNKSNGQAKRKCDQADIQHCA